MSEQNGQAELSQEEIQRLGKELVTELLGFDPAELGKTGSKGVEGWRDYSDPGFTYPTREQAESTVNLLRETNQSPNWVYRAHSHAPDRHAVQWRVRRVAELSPESQRIQEMHNEDA